MDPTQQQPVQGVPQQPMPQPADQNTQQNLMLLQALNANAAGQQASLGNQNQAASGMADEVMQADK